VEPFPAFEMYAKADNGAVKTLFRISPTPGSTPWNLPMGPTKAVHGQVTV
jgi:hypothetical protein